MRVACSASSFGSSRSMPTIRLSPSASAHLCVSTPSPQPTSSTELGAACANSSPSVPLEVRHQPPHDRVRRAVLVERVAGAGLPRATAADVVLIPRLPFARRSRRSRRRGLAGGRVLRARRARSGTAGCRAAARSGARARRSAATAIRWAASRSPMTPSANSSIVPVKRTEPRISDWTWPAPSPCIQETRKRVQTASASTPTIAPAVQKTLQRLVLRVDAEDRDRVAAHVGAHRREQPRLARLRVRPDRHVVDRDQLSAGLDDRLERVGELRRRRPAAARPRGCRRGSRRSCRARRSTEAWRTTHEPSFCSEIFSGEKCSIDSTWRSPIDHVGAAGEDRRDQLRDVAAEVLVVGVGVDDDVGAELQRRVEAGLEAGRQALVVRQLDDVVDAVRARDLDRAVGRAVVDHEHLDLVEARDRSGQIGERRGKRAPPRL